MNTLSKILSSFVVGDHDHGVGARTALPAVDVTPTAPLPDDDEASESSDTSVGGAANVGSQMRLTPPASGRPSRALRTTASAVTSVALQAEPMPLLPTPPPPAHRDLGVVLTETERVRLRIMQAQIRLSGLMLYEGPIDGMLTVETVTGVRWFQTLKGLRESGQLTAATLRALGVPASG
jgi:Putative peptidoglycan binding domain